MVRRYHVKTLKPTEEEPTPSVIYLPGGALPLGKQHISVGTCCFCVPPTPSKWGNFRRRGAVSVVSAEELLPLVDVMVLGHVVMHERTARDGCWLVRASQ